MPVKTPVSMTTGVERIPMNSICLKYCFTKTGGLARWETAWNKKMKNAPSSSRKERVILPIFSTIRIADVGGFDP